MSTNAELATIIADLTQDLIDGDITKAQFETAYAAALEAWNDPRFTRQSVAEQVVQAFTRLDDVIFTAGVPNANTGTVGSIALDTVNWNFYGPKPAIDNWGGAIGLTSQNWNDLTNRPVALTDGRVAAGLTADGDVARNVPSARITEASVTQHAAAMAVSTAQQTALDLKLNASAYTAADVRAKVEAATDSNVFTDADHTKLDGVASNADLRDRTTHTGEQAIATVAGLQTALDAKLAAVEGMVRQSVQTAAFTAVAGRRYPCNTAGGGFAVTLPAGSDGDRIELYDPNGSWAFAFVEVIGSVLGYETNPLCDVAGGFVTLTKHGALWVIHASPPTYNPYNLEDA